MNKLLYKIFLCAIFLFATNFMIYADQEQDVRKQIDDVSVQIQTIDREIAKLENQIVATGQEKDSLSNLIKQLVLTRSKLLKEKQKTQKKIMATTLVIGSLAKDIKTKQQKIDDSKKVLSKMIKDLYKSDQNNFTKKLLMSNSISDLSKSYNNTITFNDKIRSYAIQLSEQEKILSVSKLNKEKEQKNLTDLKKSLGQKELAISIAKKEKDTLLEETKNKEKNYQKLLEENRRKRDLFEKQLSDYESKLKFILNRDLLPSEGSGVLSWPLDNVFITQLFGRTSSSRRLYLSGSHSGVDFRASVGTQVKSMGTGVVMGVGDTDTYCKGASFGKWVFIKYDNGLSSTFGHLSSIIAKVNDKVVAGDVVGLSGNTGHSTGPHLHVTVYASQGADVKIIPSLSCSGKTFIMPIAPTSAYLDPMLYLPNISSKFIKDSTMKD